MKFYSENIVKLYFVIFFFPNFNLFKVIYLIKYNKISFSKYCFLKF